MAKTSKVEDQVQYGKPAPTLMPPLELVVTKRQDLTPIPSKAKHNKFWLVVLSLMVVIVASILIRKHWYSQVPANFETAKVERGPIQAFITATGNLNPSNKPPLTVIRTAPGAALIGKFWSGSYGKRGMHPQSDHNGLRSRN